MMRIRHPHPMRDLFDRQIRRLQKQSRQPNPSSQHIAWRGRRPRHVGQVLYSTECHGFADIREEEKAFGVKMESQSTAHAEVVEAK
jgi:hypothetical protein